MKTINLKNLFSLLLIAALFAGCKKKDSTPPAPVVKNKIAYIYKTDNSDALEYKALMEANNCEVTLIDLPAVASTNFSGYGLIVAGNNTAAPGLPWNGTDAGAIASANKPILYIGTGGFRLGDKLSTAIAQANTGTNFSVTSIKVIDPASVLYTKPKVITIPASNMLDLYSAGTPSVELHVPGVTTVQLIGNDPLSGPSYYPVCFEGNKYGGFGFYGSVNNMTQTGKDFLVNFSYYVGNLAQ